MAILEKVVGTEKPQVAVALGGLASLYESRGDYARAEPLYRRALAIREKALGPEHPEVAQTLDDLGRLSQAKGDAEQTLIPVLLSYSSKIASLTASPTKAFSSTPTAEE